MIDDQILSKFLDNAVAKAKKRIEEEGHIETEDAIPLMLKSQFNHIAHLETQMATKAEVGFIKWLVMFGFALLSILVAFVACLQFYATFIK